MTPAQIEELPPSERPMAREIARRGLHAAFNGHCWHIKGFGVDLATVKLRYVYAADLKPPVLRGLGALAVAPCNRLTSPNF